MVIGLDLGCGNARGQSVGHASVDLAARTFGGSQSSVFHRGLTACGARVVWVGWRCERRADKVMGLI